MCQAAGVIGSIFTIGAVQGWYAGINKPSFTPPDFVFGPVWISLYIMMGISFYLVWTSTKPHKLATYLFLFQLALNSLWSVIFFGLNSPFYAFIELFVLLIVVIMTTFAFWKIDKKAALLLAPYLAWSSFALVLNYAIWQMNS